MSAFETDLNQEQILSAYLDGVYKVKKIAFERIFDIEKQHQGIDLIIKYNSTKYYVDEKAQLHYLNKDLPTFTFELSYLNKNKKLKEGWLFDKNKLTQYYFLITGIFLKNNKKRLTSPEEIEKLKIISVQREKLIAHLNGIGLTKAKLQQYDADFRKNRSYNKNPIAELDKKREGLIFYSKQLTEKPVNLQLRLKYLIDKNIAKEFHNGQKQ